MTIRRGLVFAFLLSGLVLGCSRSSRPDARQVKAPALQPKGAEGPDKEKPPTPKKPDNPGPEKVKQKAREKTAPPPPPPPENPRKTATAEEGVVRGAVRWKGPVPPVLTSAEMLVDVRGRAHAVRPAARVQVDPKGGLANVVVYVKKAPPTAEPFNPETVTLVQTKGRFEPHVQVVARDSKLRLRTTDDTADFELTGATALERGLARGRAMLVGLNRLGVVTVRSQDRPWIAPAYLHVLDHGHFAVTGGDGNFVLPKLPPGDYEIVLWHEGWAKGKEEARPVVRTVPVTVGAGRGVEIQWVLPEA